MAKVDPKQAGRAFVAEILSRIPAEARADVQKHLEADGVLEYAGNGVLMKGDYSRNMNTLRGNQQAIDEWYQKHQPLLELGAKAQLAAQRRPAPAPDPLDDPDFDDEPRRPRAPAIDTSQFIDRNEAAQGIQRLEQNAMTYAEMQTRISMNHYKEFGGEVLDPRQLREHAEATGLRLDLAYNDMVAERREAARKLDLEAQLAKAREEGIAQGRSSAAADLPFLTGDGSVIPSLLPSESDRSHIGLQAALRTYAEVAAKGGSG
jgi:hypothetical protein